MVSPQIATAAEQPINRDAAVSTVTAEDEGLLVGLNDQGELVTANSDSAAGTVERAVGLLAAPVHDLADFSDAVDAVRSTVESEYALVGEDKIPYIYEGIEVVNEDNDWGFTPGEPVYLGEGGGFTQTEPSNSGDLVQIVGLAVNDGETVLLDVHWDASVNA